MTSHCSGETLQEEVCTLKRELLRLKALLVGKDGMVARSYVVEKIDIILTDGIIPLDSRNESTYRKLVEEDQM